MNKKATRLIPVLLLAVTMLFASVIPAMASQNSKEASKNVQRWKPTVIAAAKYYHVYSPFIVTKALHIMAGENGGSEHSKTSRSCIGLFQFDGGWIHSYYGKHFRAPLSAHLIRIHVVKNSKGQLVWRNHPKDWRQCGTCSIYRFMKSYHDGGLRTIKSHWRATYY